MYESLCHVIDDSSIATIDRARETPTRDSRSISCLSRTERARGPRRSSVHARASGRSRGGREELADRARDRVEEWPRRASRAARARARRGANESVVMFARRVDVGRRGVVAVGKTRRGGRAMGED